MVVKFGSGWRRGMSKTGTGVEKLGDWLESCDTRYQERKGLKHILLLKMEMLFAKPKPSGVFLTVFCLHWLKGRKRLPKVRRVSYLEREMSSWGKRVVEGTFLQYMDKTIHMNWLLRCTRKYNVRGATCENVLRVFLVGSSFFYSRELVLDMIDISAWAEVQSFPEISTNRYDSLVAM